jgi:hypothetical protein
MGAASLTAEQLAPRHERAPNSCSGVSVSQYVDETTRRYDFDADGVLVGVTVVSGMELDCSSSHTYGKSCSVTGMWERLCSIACPASACNSGITVKVDALKPFAAYSEATFEFCLNDHCIRSKATNLAEHPGANVGSYYGVSGDGSSNTSLSLWTDPGGAYVELGYVTYQNPKVNDGDRYTFKVTQSDGTILHDLTQTVEHYDVEDQSKPCAQGCKNKQIDLRGMSDVDAGSP